MSDTLVILERAGINGLPPEILGEIFVHCLNVASRNLTGTQRILSSVCRHWQTLVLATPALWASLDITCDIGVLRPPLPVIRTHLQRSGTHPLSFILRTDGGCNRRDSRYLPIVLATLAAARQRWENVELRLLRMRQDILDLITRGDAPLLRSITCHVFASRERFSIPLSMIHVYPRLESFQWDSFRSPLLLPPGNTQLTALSLRAAASISECVTILRLSPRLSSAELRGVHSSHPASVPHLIHPTLCVLAISGEPGNMLLNSLTLPALLDLDLTTEATLSPQWDLALSAFLERSDPPLHKLSLFMKKIPLEPAFVRIFANTSHLRILRMASLGTFTPLTAGLICALHPQPPSGTPPCPRLQRLELSELSGCPDGLCSAMLRGQWGADAHANGVACLERADIKIDDGEHHRDLVVMAQLRAEGMLGRISWDDGSRPRFTSMRHPESRPPLIT